MIKIKASDFPHVDFKTKGETVYSQLKSTENTDARKTGYWTRNTAQAQMVQI